MNLGELIDNFNLLCDSYFTEIIKVTGNKKINSVYQTAKIAKMLDNKKLINICIDKIYKYRTQINERNFSFFDNEVKHVKDAEFINELNVLTTVWPELSDVNKNIMFDYLVQMILCCDIYMAIVVGGSKLMYNINIKKNESDTNKSTEKTNGKIKE